MQLRDNEIIEKPYILLDWNVIKYLKTPRKDHNDLDEECLRLVVQVQKKYAFPFCEAHLRDLAQSYSENNKEKVNSDLKFLETISRKIALARNEHDDSLLLCNYSPVELFKEIIKDKQPEVNISSEMNPQSIFKVNMDSLDKNHPMRKILEKTNGVYGPGILANWLNKMFDPLFNEIEDYREFRNYLVKLKSDIINNPYEGIDESRKNYMLQHMMPFIDSLEIEEESNLRPIWKDIITQWLSMSYSIKIPLGELLTTGYIMLDLHPLFREKLKAQKNTLSNISRDSKMIFYASSGKYFITEDKNSIKKADFLFRAFGLNVAVLNIDSFISKFSYQCNGLTK